MLVFDVLFYSFIGVILLQFLYYGILFLRFGISKPEKATLKNIGISVLVCAKNEAENLKNNIPEILNQDYPKFELILINDDSSDDSLEVMKSFEKDHSNVKIVDVKPIDSFWNNKKYPLTLGIKGSTYDFLLLTDADCKPLSRQWIKEMSSHFTNDKTVVIGYGSYKKIKRNVLNLLIRFETVFTALQYFSFAKIGMPYMGVGRNLAYRKDEFFNVGGFMSHMQINSGDDDLFINQIATKSNTALCFSPDSFTESVPERTLKNWIRQKRRHVSTSNHYKWSHRLILGLFYLTQISFWILSIVLLTAMFKWQIVLSLVIFRFILVFTSYGLAAKKFKEVNILLLLPFLELFLILAQLVIFISNLTSKTQHWR